MRLSVSNIAWDTSCDDEVGKLLTGNEVFSIDIAPGKYFPNPLRATTNDVNSVKKKWADRGIAIVGMQSLLFGAGPLNLFGDAECRSKLFAYLSAMCRIGCDAGATRLVFGSPKNRDRTGLNDQQSLSIATEFFQQLGDVALDLGVTICLEPNPERYGANFMTDTEQTRLVVAAIDHPAILMQLDTGSMTINDEDCESILRLHSGLIGHVHISEPDLVPIGNGGTNHSRLAAALSKYVPNHICTLEMLASSPESQLADLKHALAFARAHYVQ